jgi:hypothetical protein
VTSTKSIDKIHLFVVELCNQRQNWWWRLAETGGYLPSIDDAWIHVICIMNQPSFPLWEKHLPAKTHSDCDDMMTLVEAASKCAMLNIIDGGSWYSLPL